MVKSITVRNIGKRYQVYFEKPALIKNILPFFMTQGKPKEFWALRDVSFDVEKGECVGIVGPNGSGKSTLLSILAGVTVPTQGDVQMKGRVSSLLSLGAGFNFELTGQENIYLNAAILGLTKARIDELYDDIVDFADLGKFMSAKLSTYSAGMNMRLGFAIAVMVPFDILLIDEILAVGDLKFQTKCFRAMKRFYENRNKAIIFISHDLDRIGDLCTRVIWMEHGGIEQIGSPSEVLGSYKKRYSDLYKRKPWRQRRPGGKRGRAAIRVDSDCGMGTIPSSLFGSNVSWDAASRILCEGRYEGLSQFWMDEIRQLRLGLLRYPGGRTGELFHWEAATGKRRAAQPLCAPNAKWVRKVRRKHHLVPMEFPGDMESSRPYFGPDEFNLFAERIGVDKVIVVNVVDGTPEEAKGFLQRIDASGRPARFAELGHELYYDDFHDVGVTFPISPEAYAQKVREYSHAIKFYRPDIGIIAMGCIDSGAFSRYRYADWLEKILALSGECIDYIALHNAEIPVLNIDSQYRKPPDKLTYRAVMAAPVYVADSLARCKGLLAAYREQKGKDIRVAVTSYRAIFDEVPSVIHGTHRARGRENRALNYFRNRSLAAALYEAMLLNVLIRSGGVAIAAHASLFHEYHSALWYISPGDVCRNPQHEVIAAYTGLAGKTLLKTTVEAETFDSTQVGVVPAQKGVPYLDVIAARGGEAGKLSLYVVNRHLEQALMTEISLSGFVPKRICVRGITADDIAAVNTPHHPEGVRVLNHSITPKLTGKGTFSYTFPPHSLTVLTLEKNEWF